MQADAAEEGARLRNPLAALGLRCPLQVGGRLEVATSSGAGRLGVLQGSGCRQGSGVQLGERPLHLDLDVQCVEPPPQAAFVAGEDELAHLRGQPGVV